ncbi:MAG: zf-HC2 domain-containing protein [Rhodopirellula sp.]|nr:zf-HC2 domain-containing protein [Rhodopirellula sp.]
MWLFLPANPQQAATPDGDLQVGSICCSDVMKYAAAFRKGELDAATTARIRQHVAECPHCEPHFRHATQKPQASAVHDHADRYVAVLGDAAFVSGR